MMERTLLPVAMLGRPPAVAAGVVVAAAGVVPGCLPSH